MDKFTDDDLKRIKNYLDGGDDTWFDGFTVGTIKALITRLEAAEFVLAAIPKRFKEHENCIGGCAERAAYRDLINLMEAWRKAAGTL